MGEDFKLTNKQGGFKLKVIRVLVFVLLIVSAVNISGCGGGGSELRQTTNTTTLGQELQDLKTAYDKGIISEKEYNKAKENIIKIRTQK